MSDLTEATRELFVRTLRNQVFYKMPFYEDLERRKKITFRGGKYIERLVVKDEMDDLAQAYTVNEALTDEAKDMLAKPRFTWKLLQLPLRYSGDWVIQNANAGQEEQLLDLVKFLVEQGQGGMRRKMMKNLFNAGSATGRSDTGKEFQSLVSALDHDIAYGNMARSWSAGTRDWWQGADPSALNINVSSSSQGTATNMTISNLRKWIYESDVSQYMDQKSDLTLLMCGTLFNKLRAEMESKAIYKGEVGDTMKQGFTKMILDGYNVVDVPYLQTTSTMQTWVFILNMNEWELRISTERNFELTDFEWQGKYTNGFDYYLSRILVAGNLVCWKPRGNMFLSNVS